MFYLHHEESTEFFADFMSDILHDIRMQLYDNNLQRRKLT